MRRAHDNFDKKFGIAIRLTRIKQKLSQAELGAALGVTFQQIQKLKAAQMLWHRHAFRTSVEP